MRQTTMHPNLITAGRTSRRRVAIPLVALAASAAVAGLASPAMAKNGVETPTVKTCSPIVVTNSGRTVRNRVQPPAAKVSVADCAGLTRDVTITSTEIGGFFSATCPAPLAEPVQAHVTAGGKAATSVPMYRGACGWYSQTSPVFVDGPSAWQAHTIRLTLTDDATGAVLGTSAYSWKDDKPGV
ncbi:MAG: hypothetical protein R2699_12010 [Acidimicrobiales bacterium]|nr:hypothetical protein [Acidimicrobiales bacterium]